MGQLAAGQGEAIAGAGTGTTLRDSQRLGFAAVRRANRGRLWAEGSLMRN